MIDDQTVLFVDRACKQTLNDILAQFISDKLALDHGKPLMHLDGSTIHLRSAQGNMVELVQKIIQLKRIDKLIIKSSLESFALKALIPLVPHIIIERFNWYEERSAMLS